MAAVAFCPLQFVHMAWLAVQQEVPNIPNADELVSYFLGITLDPDMLMSDFELALIQATALNFPNASHKGYYYQASHLEESPIPWLS